MRYLKDPLTVFLAFGLILFFAERMFAGDADGDYLIEISPGQQARIFDQWQAQMGRPPTEQEASGLLEQWIREEIFYREAKKLGLDDNDTIIRRRLAQKLTFLNEDLANANAPSEAELAEFFQANLEDYLLPERFSFEHSYFSSDRRQDAEADATAALADPENAGDPFILQKSYAERSAREIGDLFGRNFAEALAQLDRNEPERWQGPIPSAYGWHLIRLRGAVESREPQLSEVMDAVQRDFLQDRRRTANEVFYEGLKSRYEIVVMDSVNTGA
jgi:parvulin-like peptidyl-prolyl isomerase